MGWAGIIQLVLLAGSISSGSAADHSLRSSSRSSRNLIIGGGTAEENRFPYYVALKDNNRDIQCGGTLIAPDIVLTAAHCRK